MATVPRIEKYTPGRARPERLVICLGDSITHGQVGSDWVATLADRYGPAGTGFVNAGVNGDLAWNVRQRLDPIIEARPDTLTLLIGTNDINATLGVQQEARYRRMKKIPVTPTAGWYADNVAAIIDRVRDQTGARILMIQIPPLGENLESAANAKVGSYNAVLKQLAEERHLELLPLFDRIAAGLPDGPNRTEFTGSNIAVTIRAALAHGLLRRSWDTISARHGLAMTIDEVHLNDRAGAILAGLVAERLDGVADNNH